jgi:hypothetical protein
MKAGKEICVLCAWRENCNKKFSISGRDVRCPDFVRDLTIKESEMTEDDADGEKEK